MRRRRLLAAVGALVVAPLLMASSCQPVDCNDDRVISDPPSEALAEAAQEVVEGEAVEVEVELEVREPHPDAGTEVECVVKVRGGKATWDNVTDDTA